ncbi:MAG: hypothetical protein ABWY45_03690 [Mycobacterium sp.]
MSWLLAASVPGLLMLVTFGLERLESRICVGECRDGAELTQQPRIRPEPKPQDEFPSFPSLRAAFDALDGEPRLPTRLSPSTRIPVESNPQFQPTRHANRV